jgi:hypothetical protein
MLSASRGPTGQANQSVESSESAVSSWETDPLWSSQRVALDGAVRGGGAPIVVSRCVPRPS